MAVITTTTVYTAGGRWFTLYVLQVVPFIVWLGIVPRAYKRVNGSYKEVTVKKTLLSETPFTYNLCVCVCVCVCVCADNIELMVVPGDQTTDKGGHILVPCVSVSIGADVNATLTWTRRKPGSQESRGDSELLTNTTDRVTIFHTREERASGVVIMKSVLHLGCVEFEDEGAYSCHVASTALNKTVEFLVDVKGMDPV